MRWIFKYDKAAAKYLGSLLHKKMPEPQPWLHVAVKTVSGRNPFSGIAVYIWDSRQVIFEYRQHSGTNSAFDKAQFTKEASGMTRAFDNREPLVGGRKDINEFFEFGKEFDASHGEAFDGPERRKITPLYKRRNAKMPGTESELSVVANNGGRVDLSKYKVIPYVDDDNIWYGIVEEDGFYYLFQDDGTMIDVWEDAETLIGEYNLHELVPANEMYEVGEIEFAAVEAKLLLDDKAIKQLGLTALSKADAASYAGTPYTAIGIFDKKAAALLQQWPWMQALHVDSENNEVCMTGPQSNISTMAQYLDAAKCKVKIVD